MDRKRLLRIGVAQFLLLWTLHLVVVGSVNPFDDSIIYDIRWPGEEENTLLENVADENILSVVTHDSEKYRCILPSDEKEFEETDAEYTGLNALDLISPLFLQNTCTYLFENYWSYEICHGKHIRQYHEESNKKVVKTQEYFLGYWDISRISELDEQLNLPPDKKVPTKKYNGVLTPYFQMDYTNGTLCDINGEPRTARVLYLCYRKDERYPFSIREIATCQYEIIVHTKLLCSHPRYKPIKSVEKEILCLPGEKAAKKPRGLLQLEADKLKYQAEKTMDMDLLKKLQAIFSIDKSEQVEENIGIDFRPVDEKTGTQGDAVDNNMYLRGEETESDFLLKFLSGEECITGGGGWWKHTFCYGRYVEQFHVHTDGRRQTIRLGVFNFENHKKWLLQNPYQRTERSVVHFYSDGAPCEENNGIPRETEVRFVCATHKEIFMYFMEPRICRYKLEIHSAFVCTLLPTADQYGIFKIPPEGFNEL